MRPLNEWSLGGLMLDTETRKLQAEDFPSSVASCSAGQEIFYFCGTQKFTIITYTKSHPYLTHLKLNLLYTFRQIMFESINIKINV
jgi:hypothetical protein